MSAIAFIPSRISSTRLPRKPLANINGKEMIVYVWENTLKSNVDRVIVATDSEEIMEVITKRGGEVVMTPSDLPSGTVRVAYAMEKIGADNQIIVNVQGDLPNIDKDIINQMVSAIESNQDADIVTPVYKMSKNHPDIKKENVVKVVLSNTDTERNSYKALYFSRSIVPHGADTYYGHIGLYVYRRDALTKLVSYQQSNLEKYESLEQLRALENNISIYANLVDKIPISVDVPDDLELARKIIAWG